MSSQRREGYLTYLLIDRSRTVKKMREALHEFALVSRGLDNTVYGNATALALDR